MSKPESLQSNSEMAERMRLKAATLPRVLDQKTVGEVWDETWKKYMENRQRLHELGFRSGRGISFRVGPPLTSEEADEVDDLTGGYGL